MYLKNAYKLDSVLLSFLQKNKFLQESKKAVAIYLCDIPASLTGTGAPLAYFVLLQMGFTQNNITVIARVLLPHVFTLTLVL